MTFDNLKYLAVPLPEDIMKEKWAGYFDRARRIIECRLEDDTLPQALRARLEIEVHHLDNLELCYNITPEEAMEQVHEKIPEMTEEEFDQLRIEGKIDWIYVNGQVRYLRSFCDTLFDSYPELLHEEDRKKVLQKKDAMDEVIHDCLYGSVKDMGVHLHIRHNAYLLPEAVEEGKELHVYIPMPVERDGIENLNIIELSPEPKKMPGMEEGHPTVYFSTEAQHGQEFVVEYELDRHLPYIDPRSVDLDAVEVVEMPEGMEKYLGEEYPHIRFTPYLRELASEIKGDETNPFVIARKIYDWVTTKVDYRYMRDYVSLENIAEYCAVNRRGDCGVQAILQITLLRICGIPAAWESGFMALPGYVSMHDWAKFYIPSVGWMYTDPAYGGDARILGKIDRWNFYFCNVDPYRLPLNNRFQQNFEPPVKFMRFDPYDNQCGEAEYVHRKVPQPHFKRSFNDRGIRRI